MHKTALAAVLLVTSTSMAAPAEVGFATKLYRELGKTKQGNLVLSPTSVRLALGIAYAGARGETAQQMRSVLGFPEGATGHDGVRQQLERWDTLAHPEVPPAARSGDAESQKYWEGELARRATKLDIADRLWVQRDKTLHADYLALVKRDYRADVKAVDFAHATETARQTINEWVSEKTQQKIRELIPRNGVNAGTRAVITNTVYFKASWDEPFQVQRTQPGTFWLSPSGSANVPFMRQSTHYASATTADADLVELPYADSKTSMVIVVPKAKHGLSTVEDKLDELPKWLAALGSHGLVDLTMPKFSMAAPTELVDALEHMGMTLPFKFPGADFSGIDGTKLLVISRVIHQATIDVDEKGTVASAATAVSMRAGGMPQEPKVIRADRPFLFLIRDRETNAVLFIGRLTDPRAR